MASDLGESFVVNVPNNGAISNLPDDAIVELSAVVDRQGAHPFSLGPLPASVLGLQWSLVLSQQLTVTAALSGSRDDLLRAILAHPLIHSVDAAEKLHGRAARTCKPSGCRSSVRQAAELGTGRQGSAVASGHGGR